MASVEQREFDKRVKSCSREKIIKVVGTEAEIAVARYLVDNLNPRMVGDYRILLNYNMPLRGPGARGTIEIDILLINRFGAFAIEVKDWRGKIEALDGNWYLNGHKRDDVFEQSITKSRTIYTTLFGASGKYNQLSRSCVAGLIVLFRGRRSFENKSHYPDDNVLEVNNNLIYAISSTRFLQRGDDSRKLTDDDIKEIDKWLYDTGDDDRDEIIGHYRVLGELSSGHLHTSYEAISLEMPVRRVRIKVYQSRLGFEVMDKDKLKLIQRGVEAVWNLPAHPNILRTFDFFKGDGEIYYEVTEAVTGDRLDEIMARMKEPLPFRYQLKTIKQLCQALLVIHDQKIYHRDVNPETIFVQYGDNIKLADFNFAKIVGQETALDGENSLKKHIYTAPELYLNQHTASPKSDVYSLGVLWVALASIPSELHQITDKLIEGLRLPSEACELISLMTNPKRDLRPSVEVVLAKVEELQNQQVDGEA